MNNFCLRLQALDGYMNLCGIAFPSDRFPKVLAVHHTGKKGDNPHYHFCITTDYKQDALRKHLKKIFTLASGNKHLSLKKWDGDSKALSYMFHEDTEPVFNTGYTDEEIEEYKEQNDVVQAKMVKGHMVVDVCVEHFVLKQNIEGTPLHKIDKKEIFFKILEVYHSSGEWLPNRFQSERLVLRVRQKITQIMVEKDGDHHWKRFSQELYQEYFPYD